MSNFKTHNPCKFLLQYHMIFVTKYKKAILTSLRTDLLHIMEDIADKYDFSIKTQEVDKDHIHLLIETLPIVSPSQVCRVLKQESTIRLWEKY